MHTRILIGLITFAVLGVCAYLVALKAGWLGLPEPSTQLALLSGVVAATIAGIVAAAIAGLGAVASHRATVQALQSEDRRLSLERHQRLTEKLYQLRLAAYPKAFALTGPLAGEELEAADDVRAHLTAIRLGLRDWQRNTAGLLLSDQARRSYAVLRDRLEAATAHEGPPTPKEMEAVWLAKTEFRRSLRADVSRRHVGELHSFSDGALVLESGLAEENGDRKTGRMKLGGGRIGKREIGDLKGNNRVVRKHPFTFIG